MAKAVSKTLKKTKPAGASKAESVAIPKAGVAAKPAVAKSVGKSAAKPADKPVTKSPAPLAAPGALAKAPKIEAKIVTSVLQVVGVEEMRKEQLLDAVAERTGGKRKDVKPIVEAVLAVMGKAIGDGQELNLKPLGKVKIARTKQVANGRVINLRLRQSEMVIKELEGTKDAAE